MKVYVLLEDNHVEYDGGNTEILGVYQNREDAVHACELYHNSKWVNERGFGQLDKLEPLQADKWVLNSDYESAVYELPTRTSDHHWFYSIIPYTVGDTNIWNNVSMKWEVIPS